MLKRGQKTQVWYHSNLFKSVDNVQKMHNLPLTAASEKIFGLLTHLKKQTTQLGWDFFPHDQYYKLQKIKMREAIFLSGLFFVSLYVAISQWLHPLRFLKDRVSICLFLVSSLSLINLNQAIKINQVPSGIKEKCGLPPCWVRHLCEGENI